MPEPCLELLRAADLVVHAGDFVTIEVLEELRELARDVVGVHGNVDEPGLRSLLPGRTVVDAENLRIGVVHDAGPAVGRHERLRAWFPDCGVLVYGHTHMPEVAECDGVWIVNPGSPTERRRAPLRTMAVVEAGTPRLVELS